MEVEYKTLFDTRGMGTTIWSPLAVGLLTGRYNDGDIPEGRILEFMKNALGQRKFSHFFTEEGKVETKRCLGGLATIAKDFGVTQAQLALCWAIANEDTSIALLGFSKISQVEENIKVIELLEKWDVEKEKIVTEHLKTDCEHEMNWRTWAPEQSRRLH